MQRPLRAWIVYLLCVLTLGSGCSSGKKFFFMDDGDLNYYLDKATELEEPGADGCRLDEVAHAIEPLSLATGEHIDFWDLSLEEGMQIALANSKVIKVLTGGVGGGFTSTLQRPQGTGAPDTLLRVGEAAATMYDPAIQESAPGTVGANPGNDNTFLSTGFAPGTEAALSAFDAQLAASLVWNKDESLQNFNFGTFAPPVTRTDASGTRLPGAFVGPTTNGVSLTKRSAVGALYGVSLDSTYEQDDRDSRLFPSAYTSTFSAFLEQPLLRGYGTKINRSGVIIARMRTDIALADFESQVRNFVADMENAYWDLYFQYRFLDSQRVARDAALASWQRVEALRREGAEGGEAANEARARQQYYQFHSAVIDASKELLRGENHLRFLMGLAPTDGRLIRPTDEPTAAKVVFDWNEVRYEALARSPELRRQRWVIKTRQMEIVQAKNLLLPELTSSAEYKVRGLGDKLLDPNGEGEFFDPSNNEGIEDSDAFSVMTQGDYTAWQLGLQFRMPIGFRQELAAVRHTQLRLARAEAILCEQELELVHQLTDSFHVLRHFYDLTQNNLNRRVAAAQEVKAVEEAYKAGLATLDLLLDAQSRLANADSEYYGVLTQYTKAIMQLHFRKGTLLDYCGVYLSEGPWPAKAYCDARDRAQCRSASLHINYGMTTPVEIPGIPVHQDPHGTSADGTYHQADPNGDRAPTPVDGNPNRETLPEPMLNENSNEPAILPPSDDQAMLTPAQEVSFVSSRDSQEMPRTAEGRRAASTPAFR